METEAADGAEAEVLSSIVHGQTELHSAFGGVVPEIAARAHAEKLDVCVVQALQSAGLTLWTAIFTLLWLIEKIERFGFFAEGSRMVIVPDRE